jgi:hypothetical protein
LPAAELAPRTTLSPDRIRLALALYDLPAVRVAEEAGIHPARLSRVLSGQDAASPEYLTRIHAAVLRLLARSAPREAASR